MKDIIMSNYWIDRFTAEENRINELSKEQVKEAKKQYDIALKNTNQKIYEFYAKYAKDNNISMYEAKQRFNKKELKEFKMSLSEYIRKGQSLNISPDDMIIKELKNVSSRVHIERLEALKMEIKAEIDLLSKTMENNLDKHLREVYRDTYYRSAYSIQKGLDKFSNIEKLNPELIERLVYKPWTKDNTNWSKRIWGNDSKLVNTLHTNLTQNIIVGKPLKDIIDIVEERFNVERNIATRLIMTESAAYHSRAKERCMKDLGCEKYEVIATLDDRTSSICRSMDGKVFNMKDYQVGVTASPFHSNCRSVTAPYYDKIEGDTNLRASRTEDDDYELVDVKDYQDWYDNYVEKKIIKRVSAEELERKLPRLTKQKEGFTRQQEEITCYKATGTKNKIYMEGKTRDTLMIDDFNNKTSVKESIKYIDDTLSRAFETMGMDKNDFGDLKVIVMTKENTFASYYPKGNVIYINPVYLGSERTYNKIFDSGILKKLTNSDNVLSNYIHELTHTYENMYYKKFHKGKDILKIKEENLKKVLEFIKENGYNVEKEISLYAYKEKRSISELLAEANTRKKLGKSNKLIDYILKLYDLGDD